MSNSVRDYVMKDKKPEVHYHPTQYDMENYGAVNIMLYRDPDPKNGTMERSAIREMFVYVVGSVAPQRKMGFTFATKDKKAFQILEKLVQQEFSITNIFEKAQIKLEKNLDDNGNLVGGYMKIDTTKLTRSDIDLKGNKADEYQKEFEARGENYKRVKNTIAALDVYYSSVGVEDTPAHNL